MPARKLQKVSLQQIEEWLENPVTLAFRAMSVFRRDEAIDEGGLNAYTEYHPHHTQEYLARLSGKGDVWEEIIDTLDGEGLWELEDEE